MSVAATPRETRAQRITRLIATTVLAPLLLLAILPVSLHVIQKPDLGLTQRGLEIQAVAPGGPSDRAGLVAGDRIVAVDGAAIRSTADWFAEVATRYDLAPRELIVERDGTRLVARVVPERRSRSAMVFGLSTWLAGLSFLMIGWWVLARRHDEVARDFFGLCFIFAFFLADIPDLPSVPYQHAKQILREVLQYLWPAAFLRFIVLFPATNPVAGDPSRRWLYAPALGFVTLTVTAQAIRLDPGSPPVSILEIAATAYVLGYFFAGLVVFARKVLRRDRPVLHTKLRVILLGLILGIVPFLTAFAVGSGLVPTFPNWEYLGFSLLLVPVSFGLAIMRYGALDTAFVVRASLVYGLLTVLVLTAYLATVALIGNLISRTYQVSAYPILVVVIAISSLVVLPLRRRVQGWVDAAFYPSRRANQEAISALSRGLAVETDPEAAHEMLLARLHHLYRDRKSVV